MTTRMTLLFWALRPIGRWTGDSWAHRPPILGARWGKPAVSPGFV